MRRRTMLLAGGAGLSWLTGCLGGPIGDPSESTGSTETTAPAPARSNSATPTVAGTPSEAAFRSAVRDVADHVVEISTGGDTWYVEYHVGVCCGDAFDAHQVAIARNFSRLRTGNVTLVAVALHECQRAEWRVPASLAAERDRGEVGPREFADGVRDTTERTSDC